MHPDYPLLGLLARKPSSGYEIGRWLAADGRFLGRPESMTPIYRALSDLSERCWIEAVEVAPNKGPASKVYHLTPAGREALQAWAASDYEPAHRFAAPDFAVRMHFAGQFGPDYALAIVRAELAKRRQQRAHEADAAYDSTSDDLIEELDPAWVRNIDLMMRNHGWETGSALIAWLETIERTLTQSASHRA